mgnify:CR=1 FL=1
MKEEFITKIEAKITPTNGLSDSLKGMKDDDVRKLILAILDTISELEQRVEVLEQSK